MAEKSLKSPFKFCRSKNFGFSQLKTISKCKNDDFANESDRNSHTFLIVRAWELRIEDGMILEKIFALFILENLEKQVR